ncbi:MAG: DUF4923 family protein [Bacteroidales bacterium]|nr:DUF4923 family protein [Bacteroidales bacterium]
MKQIILRTLVLAVCIMVGLSSQAQLSLGNIVKGLANRDSTSTTSSSSSSGLGSTLSSLFGGLLSTDKLSVSDLVGTWNYSAPAVSFQSENLLQKAGGAVAGSTIEGKLESYYKMAGFDKLTLTVAEDSTFTMTGRTTLKGTLAPYEADGSQANFQFKFKLAGKLNIGSMDAYVVKSNNQLQLMFDVTKLITILKAAGSISGNSTLQSVVSLLESYDGICAGFELTKSN